MATAEPNLGGVGEEGELRSNPSKKGGEERRVEERGSGNKGVRIIIMMIVNNEWARRLKMNQAELILPFFCQKKT